MFKFILITALIAHVAAAGEEAHAETKNMDVNVEADGFKYDFETSNHIQASAHGDVHGNADGHFEWVSPEGVHVKVSYVADEQGYHPASDLLPTPPPVPAHVLKALEYIKSHPGKEQ
uniref:Uncharacterized protein n=2 Tax=Glossina TaxID=44049 RepID=A0A1B0GBG2_GLOMM